MSRPSKTLCRAMVIVIVAMTLTMSFAKPANACSDTPFLGTVCTFGFNFCPRGWASTDGQFMSIAQNTALFSLLGTTYGGDGQTTFALPDLRGRSVRSPGQGPGLSVVVLGEVGGDESTTLTVQELPAHNHALKATSQLGDGPGPKDKVLARMSPEDGSVKNYSLAGAAAPNLTMGATSIGQTGGGQPFEILPPYLSLTTCIALEGIFPSRN